MVPSLEERLTPRKIIIPGLISAVAAAVATGIGEHTASSFLQDAVEVEEGAMGQLVELGTNVTGGYVARLVTNGVSFPSAYILYNWKTLGSTWKERLKNACLKDIPTISTASVLVSKVGHPLYGAADILLLSTGVPPGIAGSISSLVTSSLTVPSAGFLTPKFVQYGPRVYSIAKESVIGQITRARDYFTRST